MHEVACTCPECGGTLKPLGEDVSEVLEYVPGQLRVIRHVRPKLSCARCSTVVQSSAPSRPIAKGLAGPELLAHVLVSKYCDHLPLNRQAQIYAREGVELRDAHRLEEARAHDPHPRGHRGGRAATLESAI